MATTTRTALLVNDSAETAPVATAIAAFIARRDRAEHPDGSFDNARRWYPSADEHQPCCDAIRGPSRAHPYSLMVHCRTADHVARLYGVSAAEIKRAARKASPAKRLGGEFFKAVAVVDGRYLSIFDGATEYAFGQTLIQSVRTGHGGGYYVYATAEAARAASVPSSSELLDAPRAIIRVRAEGQYTRYACECDGCREERYYSGQPLHPTKIAFSRITPLAVEE